MKPTLGEHFKINQQVTDLSQQQTTELRTVSTSKTNKQMEMEIIEKIKDLPKSDSICSRYYKVRSLLGAEYPRAYTDLPDIVRVNIARNIR